MPRLPLAVASFAAALLLAPEAAAHRCIGHAYESMSLKFVTAHQDGAIVDLPVEIGVVDEIVNDGADGKEIVLWNKETMRGARRFRLEYPRSPSPAAKKYIAARSRDSFRTACEYTIPYTPILPGTYTLSEGEESRAWPMEKPVLTIGRGRAEVTITYSVRGSRYSALYAVTCASFEWDPLPECAPSEPDSAADFPEEPGAPPPSPVTAESVLPATRAPRGCGGCATGNGNVTGSIALVMAIALARLRRRRG